MRRASRLIALCLAATGSCALASSPPAWVMSQLNAADPEHDADTDAVVLYAQDDLAVQPDGRIAHTVRRVYRILRAEGERRGMVVLYDDTQKQIDHVYGWSVSPGGKSASVNDRDIVEGFPGGLRSMELMAYTLAKTLRIPAAVPGSVIAYEYQQKLYPYMLADVWDFQGTEPVREAHYTLEMPAGWRYKAAWINHEELLPTNTAPGRWQWVLTDIKGLRTEKNMPPLGALEGKLAIALQPPSNAGGNFGGWNDIGRWYRTLSAERRDASDAIQQKVRELSASQPSTLGRMRALASFVQSDIRYVAIELGIGGYQPHAATAVYANLYGDCKDKVTLFSSMLQQLGVNSYYVLVNTERGAITEQTPASPLAFNHVVIAVRLPDDVNDPTLRAVLNDPRLGRLLIFDPTNPLVPFGMIGGYLQGSHALQVGPEGGSLVTLPELPPETNVIERSARMQLDGAGLLRGDVHEVRLGDRATTERGALDVTTQDTDRIKPVEALMAESFPNFLLTKATIANLHAIGRPLEWNYSFEVEHYAKISGNLLMVRPRVLGRKSSALLETREPRRYDIEFTAPERDTDTFEIALPDGYDVDDLPPALDVDYPFGSYHSKTEVVGRTLTYHRTYEIRTASVPVAEAEALKRFYRAIDNDERMLAVLRKTSP
jgi:hypothetical protein